MPVYKVINKAELDDLCLLYNKVYSRWLLKVYSRVLARGELVEDNCYFRNWSLSLKLNKPVVSIAINFAAGRGRVTISKLVYRGFSLGSHRELVDKFRSDFVYADVCHRLMYHLDGPAKVRLIWNPENQYYILDCCIDRPRFPQIILSPGRTG